MTLGWSPSNRTLGRDCPGGRGTDRRGQKDPKGEAGITYGVLRRVEEVSWATEGQIRGAGGTGKRLISLVMFLGGSMS